jgi:hypothetical protein
MADDPQKRDYRDRNRVSESEEYEVRYFAEENGISPDQARALIHKYGNDRATLTAAARKLRKH